MGVGSTTIKAYYDSLYLKSMTVNVVDVSLNPTTLYLGKNQTGAVSVTVNPSGYASSVSFVSSNTNIATVSGSAPTINITGKAPGTATVSAFIGGNYFTSMTVNVVDVQIIEPNNDPVTDNNFTFNAASPGVCDVNGSGTSGISSEDSNIIWSIPAIAGSSLSSIPPTPAGPIITFRYTSLPSNNNQFGNKTLSLSHSLTGDSDSQIVQIFFSAGATNHPGAGSGTTPNWYYYWSQTSANTGSHVYSGSNCTSVTFGYYIGGESYFHVCPAAKGINPTTDHDGIDSFAETCIHENLHHTHWNDWVQPGLPDTDGDWAPDSVEDANGNGVWDWVDANGNGVYDDGEGETDFNVIDTDGDGKDDEDEMCYQAEYSWVEGSADSEDWSNPGHQSNK